MKELKSRNSLGPLGEEYAQKYLKKRGFSLVEKNYRCRFGEIDLIMKNKEYLIFAEVKTRSGQLFAQPKEYVDYRKQKKIILTAEWFLSQYETCLQPRFDVIEVFFDRIGNKPRIEHIPNAFSV